jgi:hypothetical protein
MRKWILPFAIVLGACSGQLPPGPAGKPMELRQYLPDSLRTGPVTPDSTFKHEIVVGPDSARVELTWTTFKHGTGLFLSNVSARLVQPVRYDSLTLYDVSELKNIGSKVQTIESAKVRVAWYKTRFFSHSSGVTPFDFGANGRRVVYPAVAK